ncbi:hypothetical protein C8R43DRAFT_1236499 [Mycena crocata]|nr:hypothetical protein C8R43DRAFT_1236499 [Mycena crocata]
MHHLWTIVEVVEAICEAVALLEGGSIRAPRQFELYIPYCNPSGLYEVIGVDASRTLAILARTSSIFLHPAVNALWRGQDTLEYLFRLLPPDMNKKITPSMARGKEPWPIVIADWERVLFYSRRIRYLSIETYHINHGHGGDSHLRGTRDYFASQFLGAFFFSPFLVLMDGVKVFPNLKRLGWDTTVNLDKIRYFLGPQLERLHIAVQRSVQLEKLISSTRNLCPSLTHLRITGASRWPGARSFKESTMVAFMHRLKYLQHLDMDELKWVTLEGLKRFPGLKSLTVREPPQTLRTYACAAPAPYLTGTHCAGSACMKDAKGFVVVTTFAMNSILEIAQDQNLDDDLHHFYSLLADHYSPSSLTKLSIVYTPGTHPKHAASIPSNSRRVPATAARIQQISVDLQALQPLLCFNNLVEVQLADGVGFDLDDAAVEALARACPRLEHLSLRDAGLEYLPWAHVTLAGLVAFAKHCPQLQSLGLAVNATVVPERGTVDIMIRQNSLAILEVSNLPITAEIHDERGVAEFLSITFPALRRTCGWPSVERVLQERRRRGGETGPLLGN